MSLQPNTQTEVKVRDVSAIEALSALFDEPFLVPELEEEQPKTIEECLAEAGGFPFMVMKVAPTDGDAAIGAFRVVTDFCDRDARAITTTFSYVISYGIKAWRLVK